jgi:hypothetical protein
MVILITKPFPVGDDELIGTRQSASDLFDGSGVFSMAVADWHEQLMVVVSLRGGSSGGGRKGKG